MKKRLIFLLMILFLPLVMGATEIQLLLRGSHYLKNISFDWVKKSIDEEYAKGPLKTPSLNPSFEILIGKFRSSYAIGIELDKSSGVLRKEIVYRFPVEIGIPDLKDISTKKNTIYSVLVNNYFALCKSKIYKLSLALGAGLGFYKYQECFDIQLSENTRQILRTSKTGYIPAIKASIMNQLLIKNFGVVLVEGGIKNGFFIAGGFGVKFSL